MLIMSLITIRFRNFITGKKIITLYIAPSAEDNKSFEFFILTPQNKAVDVSVK